MDQTDREFLAKLTQVIGEKLEDLESLTERGSEERDRIILRLDRIIELLEERP